MAAWGWYRFGDHRLGSHGVPAWAHGRLRCCTDVDYRHRRSLHPLRCVPRVPAVWRRAAPGARALQVRWLRLARQLLRL